MTDSAFNVLFLCTGNSARSILAEALLRHAGGSRIRAMSAGSHPKGVVHPLSLDTLRASGVSTDGLRSKTWDEFAGSGAPSLHLVITVCDQAAGEACPFWAGAPVSVHWGMPDPAAVDGGDVERRQAFQDTAMVLRRRIDRLVQLPLSDLDRNGLAEQVRHIGRM